MKFKFTPKIFEPLMHGQHMPVVDWATQLAQTALDKYLSECPVVYGQPTNSTAGEHLDWNWVSGSMNTHRALLFNVEKLEPVKCEHKIFAKLVSGRTLKSDGSGFQIESDKISVACADCGIKLIPTGWKAEGE